MSDTIRPACLSPGELAGLIRQAADWGRAGGRHAILCESIHRLCAHVAYLDELLHRFTTDHDAYLAGRADERALLTDWLRKEKIRWRVAADRSTGLEHERFEARRAWADHALCLHGGDATSLIPPDAARLLIGRLTAMVKKLLNPWEGERPGTQADDLIGRLEHEADLLLKEAGHGV